MRRPARRRRASPEQERALAVLARLPPGEWSAEGLGWGLSGPGGAAWPTVERLLDLGLAERRVRRELSLFWVSWRITPWGRLPPEEG